MHCIRSLVFPSTAFVHWIDGAVVSKVGSLNYMLRTHDCMLTAISYVNWLDTTYNTTVHWSYGVQFIIGITKTSSYLGTYVPRLTRYVTKSLVKLHLHPSPSPDSELHIDRLAPNSAVASVGTTLWLLGQWQSENLNPNRVIQLHLSRCTLYVHTYSSQTNNDKLWLSDALLRTQPELERSRLLRSPYATTSASTCTRFIVSLDLDMVRTLGIPMTYIKKMHYDVVNMQGYS